MNELLEYEKQNEVEKIKQIDKRMNAISKIKELLEEEIPCNKIALICKVSVSFVYDIKNKDSDEVLEKLEDAKEKRERKIRIIEKIDAGKSADEIAKAENVHKSYVQMYMSKEKQQNDEISVEELIKKNKGKYIKPIFKTEVHGKRYIDLTSTLTGEVDREVYEKNRR